VAINSTNEANKAGGMIR